MNKNWTNWNIIKTRNVSRIDFMCTGEILILEDVWKNDEF